MALTGQQVKLIQDALLDSFSELELRRVVRVGLDTSISQIALGENLTDVVFKLVQWADNHSRIRQLIDAALGENPTSAALQELSQAATGWHVASPEGGTEREPYKGLDYFDVTDADLFFGRDRLTAALVAYLCDHTLLAVVGASGSGKSSLLRAGVIPALTTGKHLLASDRKPTGSETWQWRVITPTAHPVKEVAASLTRHSESVTSMATLMDDMAQDARSLDLFASRLLAQAQTGSSRPKRLLLVVDQFEELFTLCRNRQERRVFVDNLLTAAAPDAVTTIVLTLRADFYAHCAEFDKLREALESHQRFIGALDEVELRQAIVAPAKQGGWDFEPGLVDLMLEDVEKEPGALPLLSHALLETWKHRSGRVMTLAGYQATGRVQGAIARTADSTLAQLVPEQREIARNIFLRLTELGEGVHDTRRRAQMSELILLGQNTEEIEGVIKKLADARLITTSHDESATKAARLHSDSSAPTAATSCQPDGMHTLYVDVAHEALIREWSALREWLAEDREGLRTHRRLTEVAQEWHRLEKNSSELYRGFRLEQAARWAAEHPKELNALERGFLDASIALAEAERLEKEQIEREREDARQNALKQAQALAAAETKRAEESQLATQRLQRRAWLLATALLLAVIAGLATGWSFQMTQESKAQTQELAAAMGDLLGLQLTGDMSNVDMLDVRKQVATMLVQRGESAARRGQIEIAEDNFRMALALDPPSDTPVYVWVEPNMYSIGSGAADARNDEKPPHSVTLDGYWMLRTEVTNAQYQSCVRAGRCTPPNNPEWNQAIMADYPVTHVSWDQAAAYAEWIGGRLPTEAQWEAACKGAGGFTYPWGEDEPQPALLNYDYSVGAPTKVGSYDAGANGLYDMAGNIYEWTYDYYDKTYYMRSPQMNPYGPESGAERALRGGAWDFGADNVRCSARRWDHPDNFVDGFGFRVVIPTD